MAARAVAAATPRSGLDQIARAASWQANRAPSSRPGTLDEEEETDDG
jgi:hypothetical protein